ncbi:MAG TPA: hypothetical protein VG368_05720, partial [Acidimicrobiales bacterium]|nr:hypothetical protein [Acidimicrobiales bacterium]
SLYQAEKSSLWGVTPRSFAIEGFYYVRTPWLGAPGKAARRSETSANDGPGGRTIAFSTYRASTTSVEENGGVVDLEVSEA